MESPACMYTSCPAGFSRGRPGLSACFLIWFTPPLSRGMCMGPSMLAPRGEDSVHCVGGRYRLPGGITYYMSAQDCCRPRIALNGGHLYPCYRWAIKALLSIPAFLCLHSLCLYWDRVLLQALSAEPRGWYFVVAMYMMLGTPFWVLAYVWFHSGICILGLLWYVCTGLSLPLDSGVDIRVMDLWWWW